ncbi:cell division cycle protein 20 homolog B [Arapaima gigas]
MGFRSKQNAACSPEASYRHVNSRNDGQFRSELSGGSSPGATRRRRSCAIQRDPVCRRLPLDSPPREVGNSHLQLPHQETSPRGGQSFPERYHRAMHCGREQRRKDSAAFGESPESCQAPVGGLNNTEEPFGVLETAVGPPCARAGLEARLAVPGVQDDYYLNLLDWSQRNMVALGLGSAVHIWDAEVQALRGSLHVRPPASLESFSSSFHSWSSVSSVAWSEDGRTLAVGKRDGEIQLWDVERRRNLKNVTGHLSLVGSLSFNLHVLSSGSLLGFIHHHDVRVARPTVGSIRQQKGICGLQWCPDGGRLASGTTDGLLSIWPNDPGNTQKCLPWFSVQHLTAVKALRWCPWQLELVAVGGGREDGTLRIWDTNAGVCLQSAQSNSQICSLCWSPKSEEILTGHSLPHHQMTCWKVPSLAQLAHIHGHKGRVLHMALSPCGNRVFTVGWTPGVLRRNIAGLSQLLVSGAGLSAFLATKEFPISAELLSPPASPLMEK